MTTGTSRLAQPTHPSVPTMSRLLTGWESFHWRNNSFREHNTLFIAHMQPCSFYKHNTGIPLSPMIQWHNYLLSTSPLSKKTINMLICLVWKEKEVINTNKYEQAMSDNRQHRVPYCTLVSSFKGPVSLVILLAGHNGTFALVEVNSHSETLNWG